MSDLLAKNGLATQVWVSLLVLLSFLLTLAALVATIFMPEVRDIPAGLKEVLLLLVGIQSKMAGDVVAYWLGSSHGSAMKTEKLSVAP